MKRDVSIIGMLLALFAFMGTHQRMLHSTSTFTEVYVSGDSVTNADKISSEAKRAIGRLRSSRDTIITIEGQVYHIYPIKRGDSGENESITQLGSPGSVSSGEIKGE